jgi:hypothetical protein
MSVIFSCLNKPAADHIARESAILPSERHTRAIAKYTTFYQPALYATWFGAQAEYPGLSVYCEYLRVLVKMLIS